MGALFHRSKVTRRSQCSCFELESRRIHCCLLETFATVFLDSILAALDFTQDRLILPFLCHLFNKKNKTFNNITVQREKEPQGAHSVWFQHDTVIPYIMPYSWNLFWDHLSIGRVSFNVVKSFFLRCLSDVTSPHHTRGPSFAVFRVTLFFFICISFSLQKAMLGRWRSSPPT